MTDHIAGFIVVLEKNMREDDAEAVLTALRMTKHVISVEPIEGDYALLAVTHSRVRRELADKLWASVEPIEGDYALLAVTHSRVRRELADKLWAILYPKDQA